MTYRIDKQNMTVHRWFAAKACPGDYLYNLHSDIADKVNSKLKPQTNEDLIEEIGVLCREDMKNTGILASVSLAQFILESGWGKSELCLNANNGFKRYFTIIKIICNCEIIA